MLYATDLAGTQHALPYAVFIARENKAKLMILHVLEGAAVLPYDVPDRWAEETKQQMMALFATDPSLAAEPEILVEMGRPAREIGISLFWATGHHRGSLPPLDLHLEPLSGSLRQSLRSGCSDFKRFDTAAAPASPGGAAWGAPLDNAPP